MRINYCAVLLSGLAVWACACPGRPPDGVPDAGADDAGADHADGGELDSGPDDAGTDGGSAACGKRAPYNAFGDGDVPAITVFDQDVVLAFANNPPRGVMTLLEISGEGVVDLSPWRGIELYANSVSVEHTSLTDIDLPRLHVNRHLNISGDVLERVNLSGIETLSTLSVGGPLCEEVSLPNLTGPVNDARVGLDALCVADLGEAVLSPGDCARIAQENDDNLCSNGFMLISCCEN